jgi:hypothetical protein
LTLEEIDERALNADKEIHFMKAEEFENVVFGKNSQKGLTWFVSLYVLIRSKYSPEVTDKLQRSFMVIEIAVNV